MYTMIEFIMNDILSFHDELESTFSLTNGIRQIDLLESAVYESLQYMHHFKLSMGKIYMKAFMIKPPSSVLASVKIIHL